MTELTIFQKSEFKKSITLKYNKGILPLNLVLHFHISLFPPNNHEGKFYLVPHTKGLDGNVLY